MVCLAIVCLLGALALGQQPQVLVKQTELPPPSEKTVTAQATQAEAAPAESDAPKQGEAQQPEAEAAEETASQPAAPSPASEPASDKRVAAFWLVLPGEL